MKYLLANGSMTQDRSKGILDKLLLRLSLPPGIPYHDYGMSSVITSIKKSDIEETIRNRVKSVVDSVSKEESIPITVSSLNLRPDGIYSVIVKVGNNETEITSEY